MFGVISALHALRQRDPGALGASAHLRERVLGADGHVALAAPPAVTGKRKTKLKTRQTKGWGQFWGKKGRVSCGGLGDKLVHAEK